jgi:hypothetical protein
MSNAAANIPSLAFHEALAKNMGDAKVPFTPLFLTAKLIDIGLVTVYFFTLGLLFAKLFDAAYGDFEKEKYEKHPTALLFAEIVLHLFLIGVVAYLLRNLVQLIPYPLEGMGGFRHERLKELEGGHVLSIVMIFFQKNLLDKLKYFAKRVFGISVGSGGEE